VRVPNTAFNTFNTLAARLPVTVTLLAVVLAIVDDPLTFRFVKYPVTNEAILPRIFVTVVEPSVEDPVVKKLAATSVPVFVEEEDFSPENAAFCPVIFVTVVEARVVDPAVRFVVDRFVEVEFVIVPLVALIFESERFPADKVVIVAFVMVALVPIAFTKLEVDALVVVA
jgi:hypothetical protein